MTSTADIAQIAALSGDPARASMLMALMDGRALTAGELAEAAGVAPQTASGHLQRMHSAGMLIVHKQGRHRYYGLASPAIAHMIEAITEVAAAHLPRSRKISTGPRERAMRFARTCYDHMAGELGVGIADALTERGYVELGEDAGMLTSSGLAFLDSAGFDTAEIHQRMQRRSGRILCKACLDWSARRPHISGLVGSVLLRHSVSSGWVRQQSGSRALEVTPKGRAAFRDTFGIRL